MQGRISTHKVAVEALHIKNRLSTGAARRWQVYFSFALVQVSTAHKKIGS